jgi:hypothetical protein
VATSTCKDYGLEDRPDYSSMLDRSPSRNGGKMKVGELYIYGKGIVVIRRDGPLWRGWVSVLSVATGLSFQVQSDKLKPLEQPDKKCP